MYDCFSFCLVFLLHSHTGTSVQATATAMDQCVYVLVSLCYIFSHSVFKSVSFVCPVSCYRLALFCTQVVRFRTKIGGLLFRYDFVFFCFYCWYVCFDYNLYFCCFILACHSIRMLLSATSRMSRFFYIWKKNLLNDTRRDCFSCKE